MKRVYRFLALLILGLCPETQTIGQKPDIADGFELWRSGQIAEAAKAATARLAANPDNSAARHLAFLTSLVDGQYSLALSHYAQLDPGYTRIRELDKLVIEAFLSERRYGEALGFAKNAKHPKRIVTWLTRRRDEPLRVMLDETTVVPFSQTQPIAKMMPAIPIVIDGCEYLGHFDTGGAYIAMSPKMAKEAGITTTYVGEGRANAKKTTVAAGIVKKLVIGDAVIQNVPTVALDALEGALQQNGRIEDLVILGTKILEQFLATWDNQEQRLVLSPRRDPVARKEHFEKFADATNPVKFYMVPDHYMISHGSIGDKAAAFFIDTGLVALDNNGRQPALTTSNERLKRFGITAASGFADLPGMVRLGPVELSNQSVMIRPGKGGFDFGGIQLDALLAHGFFKHCVWTLDFDTRMYYLHKFRDPAPAAKISKNKPTITMKPTVGGKDVTASLKPYIGKYHSKAIRSDIEVAADGDQLKLSAAGNLRGAFNLIRTDEHKYKAAEAPIDVIFKFKVKGGKATSVDVKVGQQGPFSFLPARK